MDELRKVRRVAERPPGQLTEVLLVLDATTGQNGVVQARQFTEAVGVTGIVLTKLDGTAKGGVVLAIRSELGLPIKLVGVGEGWPISWPSIRPSSSKPCSDERRGPRSDEHRRRSTASGARARCPSNLTGPCSTP